jgi:hypothetical protein
MGISVLQIACSNNQKLPAFLPSCSLLLVLSSSASLARSCEVASRRYGSFCNSG